MKGYRVVADSSCLIGLAKINLLHLLKELFLEVYIPNAVYNEVVIELAIKRGYPINKKRVVDQLIDFGFRISNKLYKT